MTVDESRGILPPGVTCTRRDDHPAPLLSVVIPTFQRSSQVRDAVGALAACRRREDVEVIVVADGCTDGTAQALAALDVPLALSVLEQPNRGAASARNVGARLARAPVTLFLDDDMIADPELLAAHLDRHDTADGPLVVLGDLPVHSASPPSVLLPGLQRWAAARRSRLSGGSAVGSEDWLSGQVSVPSATFAAVGGFDEEFTQQRRFGGEDTDLISRLAATGAAVVFAPEAISAQVYSITPRRNLSQWSDAGRADADLVRKNPQLLAEVRRAHGAGSVAGRLVIAATTVPVARDALLPPLRAAVLAACEAFPGSRAAGAAHFGVRQLEYWSGTARAGGLAAAPRVAVLAYHAVTDAVSPRLAPWTVRPSALAAQLVALREAGFTIADPTTFLADCRGSGDLPDRSVLVTFDDAYADLTTTVGPLLRAHDARAMTFAVPGHVGDVNVWDLQAAQDRLPLLDWAGLRALRDQGWEVGGHSWTHAHLPRASQGRLRAELEQCADAIECHGLPRPSAFAFPYGEQDHRVRTAARAAGYDVLFGIGEAQHPGSVGRLEVTATDTPSGLVERVERALTVRSPLAHLSATVLRREAVGLARSARDAVRPAP